MITWSTNEVIKAPEVLFTLIRYYLQGVLFAYPTKRKIKVVDAEDVCNFYANAETAEFAGNLCIKTVKLHKNGQLRF